MVARNSTPDRLLAIARRHFADHGYEGTSIRRITAAAHTNLGAVTYHFGSKAGLYHELLRGLVAPLLVRLEEVARAPGPPLDRLAWLVEAVFDHFGRNPDLPRLMMYELNRKGPLPEPVRTAQAALRDRLLALVAEGQKDGSIRDGNPLLLGLSVVSQPVYFSLVSKVLAQVAGLDIRVSEVRQALVGHATTFVRRGLAASPEMTP